MHNSVSKTARIPRLLLILAFCAVAACSHGPAPAGIHDPFEDNNREAHEFNKALDRALLRPVSNTYGEVVPDIAQQGISNFASNLSLPGQTLNALLQLDLGGALQNTGRFLVNSTVGVAGIFDPASRVGLFEEEADFGETLAVWGVGEGAYVEFIGLGPSTERDVIGTVVDFALNPLGGLEGTEAQIVTSARAAHLLGTRYEIGRALDDIYDNSADSYAQTRLIYLQNRRFELGQDSGGTDVDPYIDPYDDIFGE